MIEPLQGFALFLFLSVLVERLTEYVLGTPFDKVAALTPFKWLLMYASMALGVAVTYFGTLDFVLLVGGVNLGILGTVLSGIAIGGGANLLHQIWPGAPKS